MSNNKEPQQRCDVCHRITTWNVVSKYDECRMRESSNNKNEANKEIVNEVVDTSR